MWWYLLLVPNISNNICHSACSLLAPFVFVPVRSHFLCCCLLVCHMQSPPNVTSQHCSRFLSLSLSLFPFNSLLHSALLDILNLLIRSSITIKVIKVNSPLTLDSFPSSFLNVSNCHLHFATATFLHTRTHSITPLFILQR